MWRNSQFHLSPEEVARLLGASRCLRDRVILELFAFTGIRRAELVGLLVADINLAARQIRIRAGKGGRERIVFYPPTLDDGIARQCEASGAGPLFPGRVGPLSMRAVNKIVADAGRRAGVPHPNPRRRFVSPHLLRHSFARNWKKTGASLESLQRILGHASYSTTMDAYGTEGLTDTEDNYRRVAESLVTVSSGAGQFRGRGRTPSL